MLGTEALRLLREKWSNVNELAEETYVILSSPDIPITTSAPITYTAPPGSTEAGITINTTDGPGITINKTGSTTGGVTITEGNIDLGGGTISNVLNITNPSGGPVAGGGGGAPKPQAESVPGTIVSGTGSHYLFQPLSGLSFNVIQGQIDPSQTIPAGTFAIATVTPSGAYIQVPVWL